MCCFGKCKACFIVTQTMRYYKNLPMQHTMIFLEEKIENFIGKKFDFFFIFWLKTYIVGICWNRLDEAVLTSTHSVCFGSKIRKLGITLQTSVFLYEPMHKKTNNMHRRKQRHRSASQLLQS